MKKVFFLLLFLAGGIILKAQDCSSIDISLTTQSEVDSFVVNSGGCTNIKGNLFIGSISSPITDISGLKHITRIEGYLFFGQNNNLYDLDDLQNLSSIGGDLSIGSNENLYNLDGLQNLIHVGGEVSISINLQLIDFCGLRKLLKSPDWEDSKLSIYGNPTNPTAQEIRDGNCN